MLRLILRRCAEAIPALFAIATITFFMVRLAPGGPFSSEKNTDPSVLASLNAHYGLDKPLYVQYGLYMFKALQGDLGPSFKYPGRSVNEIIAGAFPVSLELGLLAISIALVCGMSAGLLASLRPRSLLDHIPMTIAMTGMCVPTFVLGPILVLGLGLGLQLFPVSGWNGPLDRVLPSLTLAAPYAAYIARLMRGGMLDVLPKDFIRTARAKGVSEIGIILRHALRGGVGPVVSFLGPASAGIITGSFVIETIFAIPGLGRFFVLAAFNRDYTMILGCVLFYATLIILLNLLVDILLAWINPRLRGAS